MSNKSWFPAWLPYPKSWMMAIRLAIPAYFGATVVLAFEFWRYSIIGGFIAVTNNANNGGLIFFLAVGAIALLLALIWFLILTGVYALLLKLLWSNPLRDFGILVLSILPIVAIFAIYILFVSSFKQTFTDLRTPRLNYDIFLLRFWWLWFVSAAYLYQWCTRKSSMHDKF